MLSPSTSEAFNRCSKGNLRVWHRPRISAEEFMAAVTFSLSSYPKMKQGCFVCETGRLWMIHQGQKSDVLGLTLPSREHWCLKYVHDTRVRSKLRTLVGQSKGRKAFNQGWGLEVRQVPAPRIYGFAEIRPFGPSLLFMEHMGQHETLQHRILEVLQEEPMEAQRLRRSLANNLGGFTADLHTKGVTHKDYSSRNILCQREANQDCFYLVDFEDVSLSLLPASSYRRKHNIKDLHKDTARVPLRDKLRFVRAYQQASGNKGDLMTWTRKKLRRNKNSSRHFPIPNL